MITRTNLVRHHRDSPHLIQKIPHQLSWMSDAEWDEHIKLPQHLKRGKERWLELRKHQMEENENLNWEEKRIRSNLFIMITLLISRLSLVNRYYCWCNSQLILNCTHNWTSDRERERGEERERGSYLHVLKIDILLKLILLMILIHDFFFPHHQHLCLTKR